MLHTKVLTGIKDIAFKWDDLLKRNNDIPIFLTPEWSANWMKFMGEKHDLFILTILDINDLIAIVPFAIKQIGVFPFCFRRLEFIGRDDGDYLDFIIDTKFNTKCIEAFLSLLTEKKKKWDICDLKDFSEESQNYKILYELLKKEGWRVILYEGWRCPYIKIDGDWDGFLKGHGRKFLYNIKRGRRQLENMGELVFKKVVTQEELDRYMPEVFEVHKRRWNGFYISSRFSKAEGQKFYSEIAMDYLAKDMLRLDLLLLNDKVIAFSYSFQWNGRYFYYTPAYDPDYAKYSPGKILLFNILEDLFKSGFYEFDFCRTGELGYKSHWATGERRNKRIIFASPTLKGRIASILYLLYVKLFSYLRELSLLRSVLGRVRRCER